MQTIRRLYFYAVAFVSFELVLWGVIGLLRSILLRAQSIRAGGGLVPSTNELAQALALILVGVPIFLLHWSWAQRAAARDPEERASTVRAIFLYGIQLSTLIPVVQNTLALLDRSILETARLQASSSLVGGNQSLTDNLVAILLNGIAALYFYRVTRRDWQQLEQREAYADVRRLYRFIWVLYSLALTVWGVQQVIHFIFYIPSATLGLFSRQVFLNALALLVVGAPLWVYSWQLSLSALDEPGESESNLRLAFLYLLSLVSALTVLAAVAVLLNNLLSQALGAGGGWRDLLQKIGTPLSIAIPFGALWAYYGHAYQGAIADQPDPGRRAALQRLYRYPLSLAGLAATFVGTTWLLIYLIETLFATLLPSSVGASRLAAGLAALITGLPLWLVTWRAAQAEVRAPGEAGALARRSLVRRSYLYLVIFAAVIGIMSSAVWLVFQIINALLGGMRGDFTQNTLIALQLLLLFIAVLVYHMRVLRADGAQATDTLTARHAAFPVLVFAPDEGFAAAVAEAIASQSPDMPVTFQAADEAIQPDSAGMVKAAVLPAALALNPPEPLRLWLETFDGQKVVIPEPVAGWVWSGGATQPLSKAAGGAALALRQLAEGQPVRPSLQTSPWMIVLYILAGLFALQFLLLLLGLLSSLVMD
jgi:hypothetical protein